MDRARRHLRAPARAPPSQSTRELSVIARFQSSLYGNEKFGDMLGSQEPLAALFSLVLRT